ncbi:MAG: hypothetical protein PF440_12050 [Thiomicrorhabdus sp.]|jgi:hypothetical protein|nr:hypothetical protein [Thiomicrorhabdus sp.]
MKERRCNCADWDKFMKQIVDAQVFHALRGVKYAGKVFKFCPWCGKALDKEDL